MKKIYILALGLASTFMATSQTYTFTSAGVTGRLGPNQAQVNAAYSATNLNGLVTINTQGIQEWVVPATGLYSIETHGASGGTHATYSGYGAQVYGEVNLTMGTTLYILVGQMGSQHANTGNTDGGGGGTFVDDGTNLLFASGGGGGAAQVVNADQNASLTSTVVNSAQTHFGSAAAGYTTNGLNFNYGTYTTVAQSFTNNGTGQAGGQAGGWPGTDYGDGGFGGGGSSCSCSTGGGGGGGGYTGGGGGGTAFGYGPYPSGFGGSSYSTPSASNVTTAVLPTLGDGQVIITQLCTPLTTTVSSNTVCLGDQVTLHAESTNAGTITWNNGITDNVAFTPALGTTTYTATSSDINDCDFDAVITVNALPVVDAGVDISICPGIDTMLSGSGASTYIWDNGITDGVLFTPPNGVTTYTVTGTDANGCENTDMATITVGGPTATAVITNESLPGNGAINITVSGGSGTYTYVWSNGPTTEDITGLTAGTYTVTIDDGNCTTDTSFTVLNTIGAGIDSQAENLLQIYPNPTNGQVTITTEGQFTYTVYNLLGEELLKGTGTNSQMIDLSDFNKGSYFVQIGAENIQRTLKVVKQ